MKGRYKCDSCGNTLVDLDVLKRHTIFVHEKQKDHKCNYCQKSFSKADHLKNHIEAIHNDNRTKDYNCKSCSKSFYSSANLKQHNKEVHEDNKIHKCHICEKKFSRATIQIGQLDTISFRLDEL